MTPRWQHLCVLLLLFLVVAAVANVVDDDGADDDVVACQVRFEDDMTDDVVAAEEFVDEEDYFYFLKGFRHQVRKIAAASTIAVWSTVVESRFPKKFPGKRLALRPVVSQHVLFSEWRWLM